MFNVDKNQLSRQTGSRNLMVPKTLPTIWHTYLKLVTKYQILQSIVAEKNVTKNILEGLTDRGKTVYPSPPSGSGGIIRSNIGSKCVDLILTRLAKCWNNLCSSKFCICLYYENGKSEYIFFSCPAKFFSSRFRIKIFF